MSLIPPRARNLGSTSIARNSVPSPGCLTTIHFSTIACASSAPDEPRTSYYLNSRTYLHHLGDDPDKDTSGIWQWTFIFNFHDRDRFPYCLGAIRIQYASESWRMASRMKPPFTLRNFRGPRCQRILAKDPRCRRRGHRFDIHGDQLYLVSHHNASRFKVCDSRYRMETSARRGCRGAVRGV